MTLTTTLITANSSGTLVVDPSVQQIKLASSIHVLAFSSHGELLVVESDGDFVIDTWEKVYHEAKTICHGEDEDESESESEDLSEDLSKNSEDVSKLENALKDAVGRRVASEQRWKESLG